MLFVLLVLVLLLLLTPLLDSCCAPTEVGSVPLVGVAISSSAPVQYVSATPMQKQQYAQPKPVQVRAVQYVQAQPQQVLYTTN